MKQRDRRKFTTRSDLSKLLRALERDLRLGKLTLRALGARLLELTVLLGEKYDSISIRCQVALRRLEAEGRGANRGREAEGAGRRKVNAGSSEKERISPHRARMTRQKQARESARNPLPQEASGQPSKTLTLSSDTTLLLTRSNPEIRVAQAAEELGDRISRIADEQLQRSIRSSLEEEESMHAGQPRHPVSAGARRVQGGDASEIAPADALAGDFEFPDFRAGEFEALSQLPLAGYTGSGGPHELRLRSLQSPQSPQSPGAREVTQLTVTGLSEDVRGGLRAEQGQVVPTHAGGGLRRFSNRLKTPQPDPARDNAPDLSEGAFSLGDDEAPSRPAELRVAGKSGAGNVPGLEKRVTAGSRGRLPPGGSGLVTSGSDEVLVLSGLGSRGILDTLAGPNEASRGYAVLQAMGSIRLQPLVQVAPARDRKHGAGRRPARAPSNLFNYKSLDAEVAISVAEALRLRRGVRVGSLTFHQASSFSSRGLRVYSSICMILSPQITVLGLPTLRFSHRPNYSSCAGKNLDLMKAYIQAIMPASYSGLQQAEIWPISEGPLIPASGANIGHTNSFPVQLLQGTGEIPLISGALGVSEEFVRLNSHRHSRGSSGGQASPLLEFPQSNRDLPFSDFSGVPDASEEEAEPHPQDQSMGRTDWPNRPPMRSLEASSEPGSVGAVLAWRPWGGADRFQEHGRNPRKGRLMLLSMLTTHTQVPLNLTAACAPLPYKEAASVFAEFLISRSRGEVRARQERFVSPIWIEAERTGGLR